MRDGHEALLSQVLEQPRSRRGDHGGLPVPALGESAGEVVVHAVCFVAGKAQAGSWGVFTNCLCCGA